jgi:DNA-binding NtrC family response regulator
MAEPMSGKPLVACVDDDESMLAAVTRSLRRDGSFEVRGTLSVAEVLEWIKKDEVAVLVSDYEMPEMTGAQLAGIVKRVRPETVRILLTGRRTLDTAIDGINQGEIFRFLSKPFEDKQLREAVRDAAQRHTELMALSGDRQQRERREALRVDLEKEYPGISKVERDGDILDVTEDPWTLAADLGLVELVRDMETP